MTLYKNLGAAEDMEYLKIDGEFPRLSKSAVTLGKFDGIHRGHQKLVEKILEQKEKGLQTVLFSLGIGSQMIFTKEERCQLLEKAGVDVLIAVSYTHLTLPTN